MKISEAYIIECLLENKKTVISRDIKFKPIKKHSKHLIQNKTHKGWLFLVS